jgi:putative heme-binding domain-containing protein
MNNTFPTDKTVRLPRPLPPAKSTRANLFRPLFAFFAVAFLCFAAGIAARAQSPDSPEAERASFRLAPGFEINLFASEADGVVKPIQSRFDARGRLWVIGSTVYPLIKPGEVPNDKVVILEDTDGDGRADKSTVFAEGLFIPTGIEITGDGCLVGNSTEMLRLRDTDGDGKADVREVVLRGFGTGDNHQNINSFQWGPGGELWFSQGLHSYSHVETPWGIERLDAAGIWRLWPQRLRLDPFFGHELPPHNPWGFVFDDWNQMLVLAGNGHGIYWPLPISIRNHRVTTLDQIWRDSRGRKLCGGDYAGNAHFPPEWQGALFAGGFMNNAVYALRVRDDGSGFSVEDIWVDAPTESPAPTASIKQVNDATPSPPPPPKRQNFLTSTSTSFRPVDVKFGPDGALYITDWYNPIIGHYQSSFRHPDRDKAHGRIWRVTAKGRPLVRQPQLASASVAELLDQLKSNDRFTRHQAKRVLASRDAATVTAAMPAWLARLDAANPLIERHWMEAVGVYEAHEAVEPSLLARLVAAKNPLVRAYAAGVVSHWQDRLADPLALLRPLAADENPRVRLAAIVAATYIPNADSISVALAAADLPMDKFLDYALRQAVFVLKPHWLPSFTGGKLDLTAHPKRLEFLVQADGSPDTLRVLRQQLASANASAGTRESLLTVLADTGEPDDLARLLNPETFTRAGAYDTEQHARVLGRLAQAARARNVRPSGDVAAALTDAWTRSDNSAQRLALLQFVTTWKVREADLEAALSSLGPDDDSLRTAAAVALGTTRGADAASPLADLAAADRSPGSRIAAVAGFATFDLPKAASIAAQLLANDLDATRVAQLLAPITERKAGPAALAGQLSAKPPTRDNARVALRWLNSTGQQAANLVAALNHAAGFDAAPLRATPEFVAQLAAEVRAQGDAARGRDVFRRPELACINCHSIAGEGGAIGPDLNAIGSGQPLDFIIGAVLEPNREVKESFEAIEITTKDGESHTGFRVNAAEGEVALRDITRNNEIVRLRRDTVAQQRNIGSVMPPGLVDQLTRAELRDLFRYLSGLGKAKP